MYWYLSKTSSVFQFYRPNFGCWTGIKFRHSRWVKVRPWNYNRMNFSFFNIMRVIQIFVYFFQILWIWLLVFSSCRDQLFYCLSGLKVCHSVWGVLGPWNIVYRMKVIYNYYSSCSDIVVTFSDSGNFFQSHLIFPSSRDKTADFWISILIL